MKNIFILDFVYVMQKPNYFWLQFLLAPQNQCDYELCIAC